MTLEDSVASMTAEHIAESLEVTPQCLKAYVDGAFPDEILALRSGATIIRTGEPNHDCDKETTIYRLKKMADALRGLPVWRKHLLVYERAVVLMLAA